MSELKETRFFLVCGDNGAWDNYRELPLEGWWSDHPSFATETEAIAAVLETLEQELGGLQATIRLLKGRYSELLKASDVDP